MWRGRWICSRSLPHPGSFPVHSLFVFLDSLAPLHAWWLLGLTQLAVETVACVCVRVSMCVRVSPHFSCPCVWPESVSVASWAAVLSVCR